MTLHVHLGRRHVHIHDEPNPQERSEAAKKGWLHRQRAHVVQKGRQQLKQFSGPDYEVLKEGLSKPGSAVRKTIAQKVLAVGKSMPQLLKTHLKEEKQNAVHAAGALKALATGNKPSPEQWKGMRAVGVRVVMTSISTTLTGEPTGATLELAHHFATEVVEHVMAEHLAKLGAGAGRLIARRGRDEGMDLSSGDFEELAGYLERLAEATESLDLTERMAQGR